VISGRIYAVVIATSLALLPLAIATPPVSAATIGADECEQTVDGLDGAVARDGQRCVVALKSGSGTWTVPADVTEIEFLVVGGGGGGGVRGGGGAGAFYETSAAVTVTPGSLINATVGGGGTGGTSTAAGGNGASSVFHSTTAYGGGGGSSTAQPAGATVYDASGYGGSGGGAMAQPLGIARQNGDQAGTSPDKQLPGASGQPAGTDAGAGLRRSAGGASNAVYVFLGTPSNYTLSFYIGAGGGGAGGAGGDIFWAPYTPNDSTSVSFAPGSGGTGLVSSLLSTSVAASLSVGEASGSDVYFAGGGGGGANYDSTGGWTLPPSGQRPLAGAAGLGGGGGGARAAGIANTGGGGRGGGGSSAGAAGGSGVIVVSYLVSHTIDFAQPNNVTYGDDPFELSATSSRELDVSFTSTTTNSCTVSGSTVTIVGAGTCTVEATQAGNDDYAAAATVSRSFEVNRAMQDAVSLTAVQSVKLDETVTLEASGGSGTGVFSYSRVSGPCTVAGAVVTPTEVGTCVVIATRAGDANYTERSSAEASITIVAAPTGPDTSQRTTPESLATTGASEQVLLTAFAIAVFSLLAGALSRAGVRRRVGATKLR
jgi:hypothetical protein